MKSKNKFLDGNWHPVEETSAENLKVSGRNSKGISWIVSQKRSKSKKI